MKTYSVEVYTAQPVTREQSDAIAACVPEAGMLSPGREEKHEPDTIHAALTGRSLTEAVADLITNLASIGITVDSIYADPERGRRAARLHEEAKAINRLIRARTS